MNSPIVSLVVVSLILISTCSDTKFQLVEQNSNVSCPFLFSLVCSNPSQELNTKHWPLEIFHLTLDIKKKSFVNLLCK